MRNKAVQTVCAELGADPTRHVSPDQSLPGAVKQESNGQPGRETLDNHQPYLHALKLGHVPFLSHQDHYIRSSCLQTGTWCGRFMHEERQANGGGSVLHAYADELTCLSPAEMECFAQEFLELAFAEKPRGAASYALAVVHSAAAYLPDFLDYFAFNFPNTPVKMEIMGKKDIETTTIANFHSQVCEHSVLTLSCSDSPYSQWLISSDHDSSRRGEVKSKKKQETNHVVNNKCNNLHNNQQAELQCVS